MGCHLARLEDYEVLLGVLRPTVKGGKNARRLLDLVPEQDV